MKDIEKYIGYYLGVYVVVLAICGFFQYFSNCQGQSLMCMVSIDRIEKIITITAYVITPIIAIIGFTNWKKQNQHNKVQDIVITLYKKISKLRKNIVRLKLEKKFEFLEKYHHLNLTEFADKINELRYEYQLRVTNLRNDFDEVNSDLSLLDFYANTEIKDEFEPILDKYFRLIERFDIAYIEYTDFHLNFKEHQTSYLDNYMYQTCRFQIGSTMNSKLKSGDGLSPLLGTFECLKETQDKTIEALKKINALK